MDLDSPWADTDREDHDIARKNEWSKLSSDFTNAGYREGITAGKESAIQEGFDSGFAQVGAPIGRELGMLRGIASALIDILVSLSTRSALYQPTTVSYDLMLADARDIASQLVKVRFTDIAPPDLEAEAHAREHLESLYDAEISVPEELAERREMENLEDMLAGMGTGVETKEVKRLSTDDVRRLKERLYSLCGVMGISMAALDRQRI
ncbi:hypothetical protein AMATHDRAFT_148015 [Amanita thiersii Skay4041]|uniref:Protein YAE1 n=1 Tax=Amanita thiersii Skay4041 TaxID=703135 RepID=A0A2A9NGT8_9AGAR|nr:hypothetical protein AMATHDRAFT_148015 [Amanita thiersii Skay4041]